MLPHLPFLYACTAHSCNLSLFSVVQHVQHVQPPHAHYFMALPISFGINLMMLHSLHVSFPAQALTMSDDMKLI